jgi:hypothetical protein
VLAIVVTASVNRAQSLTGLDELSNGGPMSERNGDRARFHRDRRRKIRRRQRARELARRLHGTMAAGGSVAKKEHGDANRNGA